MWYTTGTLCRYTAAAADPAFLHTICRVYQHRTDTLLTHLLSSPDTGMGYTAYRKVGEAKGCI